MKTDALRKRDETLITVPCWWDGTEERYLNSSSYSFCFVVLLFVFISLLFVIIYHLLFTIYYLLYAIYYLLFLTLYVA